MAKHSEAVVVAARVLLVRGCLRAVLPPLAEQSRTVVAGGANRRREAENSARCPSRGRSGCPLVQERCTISMLSRVTLSGSAQAMVETMLLEYMLLCRGAQRLCLALYDLLPALPRNNGHLLPNPFQCDVDPRCFDLLGACQHAVLVAVQVHCCIGLRCRAWRSRAETRAAKARLLMTTLVSSSLAQVALVVVN